MVRFASISAFVLLSLCIAVASERSHGHRLQKHTKQHARRHQSTKQTTKDQHLSHARRDGSAPGSALVGKTCSGHEGVPGVASIKASVTVNSVTDCSFHTSKGDGSDPISCPQVPIKFTPTEVTGSVSLLPRLGYTDPV